MVNLIIDTGNTFHKIAVIDAKNNILAEQVVPELAEDVVNDIRKEIEEKLSSKIDLQLFVNPKLLGGFSLTVEGKQFDASFSKQITKLKKEFNKNIYERIF